VIGVAPTVARDTCSIRARCGCVKPLLVGMDATIASVLAFETKGQPAQGQVMRSNLAYDRRRSAAASLASVDTPVSHLHLKERSSIPSLLRGGDAFTITRMESASGLADRITKVSSVPALLVAVSVKSLARADCQFWVDDKFDQRPTLHRSGPT
jgi:hypothetical protein